MSNDFESGETLIAQWRRKASDEYISAQIAYGGFECNEARAQAPAYRACADELAAHLQATQMYPIGRCVYCHEPVGACRCSPLVSAPPAQAPTDDDETPVSRLSAVTLSEGQDPRVNRNEVISAPAACFDCGLNYSAFGMDVLLPRWQWLLLHPDDGGLLCAGCIVKRAAKLPNAVALHAVIGIAPSKESR